MGAPDMIVNGTAAGGPPIGGTGTPNTIPRWTGASTLGDSALVQSGTNAVGFGTPKTWGTNFTLNAIQLSESASLSADINTTYLAANQYWDSPGFQNRRIKANFAARYLLNGASGDHQFQIAPFGAADSAITWSTAMTILNTSGYVGIGTASPSTRLHVSDNSSIPMIVQSSGSTDSYLRFINTANNLGYIGYVGTNLYLAPNNGTGNVGIGTATPVGRADVAGTSVNQSGWGLLSVQSNDAQGADKGGSITFGGVYDASTATHWAQISGRKENGTSGQYGGYLAFATRTNGAGTNTERARIDSSGNIILNTANTGATIQAAGTSQGLKLQGTAGTNNTDPNVLDFYADGGTANSGGVTWTPELRFGGATTGITYTTRVGRYTRVGNTVIAHCYVLLSSKGSATGNVTIAGLPTSSNTSGLFASVTIGYISGVSFTNQMTGYVGPNQTEVSLFETTNAGALSTITDVDFTATSGIMFTVSYPVN